MWLRSFKASFPQKHHLQQQRRLEPCLSSSWQPFWPCPACGCWCHQPHVQLDGGARQECQALGNKSWPKKGHTIRQLIFNRGHLKVTMKPVVRRGKIRVCWQASPPFHPYACQPWACHQRLLARSPRRHWRYGLWRHPWIRMRNRLGQNNHTCWKMQRFHLLGPRTSWISGKMSSWSILEVMDE